MSPEASELTRSTAMDDFLRTNILASELYQLIDQDYISVVDQNRSSFPTVDEFKECKSIQFICADLKVPRGSPAFYVLMYYPNYEAAKSAWSPLSHWDLLLVVDHKWLSYLHTYDCKL